MQDRKYILNAFIDYAADFIKDYVDPSNTIELTTGSGLLARKLGIPYIILHPVDLTSEHITEDFFYTHHTLMRNILEFKSKTIILGIYENAVNENALIVESPVIYGISERWIIDTHDCYISVSDREINHSQSIVKKPHLMHVPSDIYSDIDIFSDAIIKIWKKIPTTK